MTGLKFSYCFIACLLLHHYQAKAQSYYRSKVQHSLNRTVTFAEEPEGKWSFVIHWAYPWIVLKDDTGRFFKVEDGEIMAADTAHLYFTASCETNVQGGYHVRYCDAVKKGKDITLTFSDGLPAYGSEFYVRISKGKFNFKPWVNYPELIPGEKLVYKVTASKLILYQKDYDHSNSISGYIDAEFTETTNGKQTGKLYFRGYFKTPVQH